MTSLVLGLSATISVLHSRVIVLARQLDSFLCSEHGYIYQHTYYAISLDIEI